MYQQQMQCDRFPIGRAWCFHSAEKDLDRCLLTAKIHSICPALNGTCLSTRDLGAPCQLPNLALGNLSFYALYHSPVFEHTDKTQKLFSSINPTFRESSIDCSFSFSFFGNLPFVLFFFFSRDDVYEYENRINLYDYTEHFYTGRYVHIALGSYYTLLLFKYIICVLCSQRAWLYNYIMYVQRVFSITAEGILWDCRTF